MCYETPHSRANGLIALIASALVSSKGQAQNAQSAIIITLLGIVMVVKLQLWNACAPILVTPFGIFTLVRLELLMYLQLSVYQLVST